MAVAKVILNSVTQMDLTSDTVAAANLLSGYTAHGADGEVVSGTYSGGGGSSGYTATISVSGSGSAYRISHNNTYYSGDGTTFSFESGDAILFEALGSSSNSIYVNDTLVASQTEIGGTATYTMTAPDADITVNVSTGTSVTIRVSYTPGPDETLMKVIDRTVTSIETSSFVIGDYAFYKCVNLSWASFPNATSVGYAAFDWASNLTSLYLPNCSYIGTYAFADCFNLEACDAPLVSIIEQGAFLACSKLESAVFPLASAVRLNCFSGCLSLKTASFQAASYISYSGFQKCANLETISFPNVTILQSYAFSGCSALSFVEFPKASIIGTYAFADCTALSSASFLASSLAFSSYAFQNCSSLITLRTSTYIKSISTYAFLNCTNFEGFENNVYINALSAYAFQGTKISYVGQSSNGKTSLYALNIYGGFGYCSYLKEVNLYQSATSIRLSTSAFVNCTSLSKVFIRDAGSYIGANAFLNCFELKTVILSKTPAYGAGPVIHASAFAKCYNLLSVYLLQASYGYILSNINAFTSTPLSDYTTSTGGVYGSFFVPESLYDSYIAETNWVTYSARFSSLTDAQIENVLLYGTHEPQE